MVARHEVMLIRQIYFQVPTLVMVERMILRFELEYFELCPTTKLDYLPSHITIGWDVV
jgi:hypothetical protein